MTSGGQKKITEKFNREEEQKSDEEEKENWKKNQKTARKHRVKKRDVSVIFLLIEMGMLK